jgi:hypothetical protein
MINPVDDPWMLNTLPDGHGSDVVPSAMTAGLLIEKSGPVTPLDQQFGTLAKKTVPDALRQALFGAMTAGPLSPPLHPPTFAILDAAKITNLPLLLAHAGLPHRCLFKGKALEDLGSVAPWIVQLDEPNAFTRALFTSSGQRDLPMCLWEKEPGIYIRSALPLDDLYQHFRKFTRIRDSAGKWFFFRFWESAYLSDFLQNAPNAQICQFFAQGAVARVCGLSGGQLVQFSPGNAVSSGPARLPRPEIDAPTKAAFAITAERMFRRNLHIDVMKQSGLQKAQFDVLYTDVVEHGFTQRRAIRTLVMFAALRCLRLAEVTWMQRSLMASRDMPEDVRIARLMNDDPEGENHAG